MPLGPRRAGENASTSTARTTGGGGWHLTGSHAGLAQQRAARLGRQPGDAGARGEEKDAQEPIITRLLRHCKLASVVGSNKYPPAEPEVLRLLAPRRGLTAIEKSKSKTERTTNCIIPELSNFGSPPAEPGVYLD